MGHQSDLCSVCDMHAMPQTCSRSCQTGRVSVQVKGEQDAAIRQAEEQAALKHRFKANPLPRSTTQPRWVLCQALK